MILSCNHIDKAFGAKSILKDVSFHVEEREKTAIVGINGAGKSTLLKIIMNQLAADSGEVTLSRGASIGYLAQLEAVSGDHTIYEDLLEVKKDIIEMEDKIRALELLLRTLLPVPAHSVRLYRPAPPESHDMLPGIPFPGSG